MKKNDVFEVECRVKIVLTKDDIDGIMSSALDSGINYWCGKAEVDGDYLGEYASEQIARGGSLILHDMESGEKYWLNKWKFLLGFRLWVENDGDRYGALNGRQVNTGYIDGPAADEIIQYALFGEVVYS